MKILIPGSFDPPTNGHIDVINRCSEIFNEIIVGVVVNPSKESLFTPEERSEMLLEMDYGDADGLFIEEFENKYPMIFSSWKNGKDEPFPNGENYEMVKKRLSNFLESIKNENCFIMTHQGVIRSFVGHNLKIDTNKWFLLQIPHLDPIHYFSMNNEYYVDIDRKLLYKIFCKYIKN